jgi:putative glutamine amidotransferase
MSKPVIGLISDYSEDKNYSKHPFYALRTNYVDILSKLEAVALIIPFSFNEIADYAEIIDGLILTGGVSDVPPILYGDLNIHEKVRFNKIRTKFEWKIAQAVIKQKKPIFGICGGMQLLNVIFNGSLVQDIDDHLNTMILHEKEPYNKIAHKIFIEEDSLLYKLADFNKNIGVNSSHHQSILKLGDGFKIVARAEDDVIEAIENPTYPFMVGVQWHPEYLVNNLDYKLFKSFIEHCNAHK